MTDDTPEHETPEGLNANHVRVLSSALAELERALSGIQSTLRASPSELSRHRDDLTAEQRPIVIDHLQHIRDRLVAASKRLGLQPPPPIPLSRWLQTVLTSAQISLDDLSPARLRGYGALDSADAKRIAVVMSDLDRAVRRLAEYLSRPTGEDLHARIQRLGQSRHVELLADLDRISKEHGLVELRPALTALVELLEVGTYEVAVFGRVSCGKSSLLNWIVQEPVLPVGATPVTAVPTRIRWGEPVMAFVDFADGQHRRLSVAELPAYITEAENPGNRLHVVRATIEVPAASLQDRMVLVDTPGVGSLAGQGVREVRAYLPRCDLGVLMIDASSTLDRDDVDLLRRLAEGGIDAQVVLSKADLVPREEWPRVRAFFEDEITRALGRGLPIDLVSTRGDATLAKQWFADRVAPLCYRVKEMREESASRKLAALHGTVLAILRTKTNKEQRADGSVLERIETLALAAESELRELSVHAETVFGRFRGARDRAVRAAARRARGGNGDEVHGSIILGLTEVARELCRSSEMELTSARAKLQGIVVEMARVASEVSEEELHVDLATMPALRIPRGVQWVHLHVPHWPAAERRLIAKIEALLGPEIEAAFDDLQCALQHWTAACIEQLAAQMAARIEPARAHGRSASGDMELALKNLESIERW